MRLKERHQLNCVHVCSVINILIFGNAICCLLLRTAGYKTTQNAKIKVSLYFTNVFISIPGLKIGTFHSTRCCILGYITLSILNVIHKEIQQLQLKSVHNCQPCLLHEIYLHLIFFTQKIKNITGQTISNATDNISVAGCTGEKMELQEMVSRNYSVIHNLLVSYYCFVCFNSYICCFFVFVSLLFLWCQTCITYQPLQLFFVLTHGSP